MYFGNLIPGGKITVIFWFKKVTNIFTLKQSRLSYKYLEYFNLKCCHESQFDDEIICVEILLNPSTSNCFQDIKDKNR